MGRSSCVYCREYHLMTVKFFKKSNLDLAKVRRRHEERETARKARDMEPEKNFGLAASLTPEQNTYTSNTYWLTPGNNMQRERNTASRNYTFSKIKPYSLRAAWTSDFHDFWQPGNHITRITSFQYVCTHQLWSHSHTVSRCPKKDIGHSP